MQEKRHSVFSPSLQHSETSVSYVITHAIPTDYSTLQSSYNGRTIGDPCSKYHILLFEHFSIETSFRNKQFLTFTSGFVYFSKILGTSDCKKLWQSPKKSQDYCYCFFITSQKRIIISSLAEVEGIIRFQNSSIIRILGRFKLA